MKDAPQSAQPLVEHGAAVAFATHTRAIRPTARGTRTSESRFSALPQTRACRGRFAPLGARTSRPQSRARASRPHPSLFSHQGLAALRFIAAADRPSLVGDGHSHRLAPVVEAGSAHEGCDALLSRQSAIRAPGEVRAVFRHVDAGIGDETMRTGRHSVGDSQERQAAGGGVDGSESRPGDAKAEGG